MRSDAYIDVTCDNCGDVERWEPEFVYTDYSGRNGHYETTDGAFTRWCESEGWSQDDQTFFGQCLSEVSE